MEVGKAICLTNKLAEGSSIAAEVVAPTAVKPDLVLWYQFDKSLPVDDSGHWRHLADEGGHLSPVPVGPGVMGRGASAAFDGRCFRTVRRSEALETEAFTVALWLYLLEDSSGSWRTIFSKAADAEQLTPALLIGPDERRLHARASPRIEESGGSIESKGLLPLRRWTHIAVASTGSILRLFINGIMDGEVVLERSPSRRGGDLYIGRDPWRAGVKAYVDDFRWYDRSLSTSELRMLTYPSLTGISAGFVHLGCSSCQLTEAARSCSKSRAHVCSQQELLAGGFHTARAMGWLDSSPEVWYNTEKDFSPKEKLGLCCAD